MPRRLPEVRRFLGRLGAGGGSRPTALLIPAREAEIVHEHWPADRPRPGAPGLPLHITILFPFLDPGLIDPGAERRLTELARAHAPFPYSLTHLERFPGVLYLAPEPAGPFVALTEAVHALWPAYPPYGGEYESTIPHLTVAGESEPPGFAAAVQALLPIRATAHELLLMRSEHSGIWSLHRRFRLGAED